MRRSLGRPVIVAMMALMVAASSVVSRDAKAFCRTTTCDPNAGDTCRKNDSGCVRDGVILKWTSLPIVYRFHSAGSSKLDNTKAREAIRNAFQAWENVTCTNGHRTSLRFREGEEFDTDKPLNEKQAQQNFGIYFRDDSWPHDDAEESLALTNQVYGKVTGTIDYADIEINTAVEKFSVTDDDPGIDLQAVLTHEVGHYIGLAHSLDPTSIMVARYCQSQDRCESTEGKRQLSDDDITAVCAAYEPPRNEPTTSAPQPGCSLTPFPFDDGGRRRGNLIGFAGLSLLLLIRRRWRS